MDKEKPDRELSDEEWEAPPPSAQRRRDEPTGINWTGVRDEYVTGTESLAKIAQRLGVAKRSVEKHALDREENGGRTWTEWREQFREDVSGRRNEIVKRIQVESAAAVSMQHAQLLAELAGEAREAVKSALAACEPKDKVKLALAIIMAERRIHGLDRTPVKLEVTGKDGKAIEHELGLGFELDDETRDFAQRTLDVIFGPAADPDRTENSG